jgi:hypothetical protein
MIFGKPPDHLIKVATLIKDFWKLWEGTNAVAENIEVTRRSTMILYVESGCISEDATCWAVSTNSRSSA